MFCRGRRRPPFVSALSLGTIESLSSAVEVELAAPSPANALVLMFAMWRADVVSSDTKKLARGSYNTPYPSDAHDG